MGIVHLFPKSGFDQSTTTPVLIGVLLSWMFTEWFGWVFAGLVVPGYLAAVFLLDPRAACIDVIEAILAYALARGLGEWLPRTGLTSRVFGRERFFLVVLSSILVRLAVEGALLPRLLPHATWAFSIGLVVVPLAANACWKTGLFRGAVQNGVPTLLTYLVLRFVLVPHTNLSLAGFELATENIAASFLASPKAYILLITGAVLAAATNIRYGWDFNGILVPALLALVVIEPVKFLATFAEVGVLLVVMALLIKTTPLGRVNIEGPRKTVLFFSIDYALRFAFAGLVGRVMPGGDVVELMGFGYLLPTLLAVKASTKGSVALVLLPAAKVSLAAFVMGSLVGFAATLFDRDSQQVARAAVTRSMVPLPEDPAAAALWLAALARPTESRQMDTQITPARAIASLVQTLGSPTDDARARDAGFNVQRIDHGVAILRERFETAEGRLGDPSVIASTVPHAGTYAVAIVSQPVSAPEVAALAGRLVGEGILDAVVIAGVDEAASPDRAPQATARSLARALAYRGDGGIVIELREAPEGAPAIARGARAFDSPRVALLLSKLRDRLGSVRTAASSSEDSDVSLEVPLAALDGWFATETTRDPAPVTLASSTAMALAVEGLAASETPPRLEELAVLRRLLLEPLLGATDRRSTASLRFAAETLGYRLHGPTPMADGDDALVLLPEKKREPIAVIARVRGVHGTIIELPQGDREGPRDLALRLAIALDADAVLLGLEPGAARLTGVTMRTAHDIASAPDATRTPSVLLLREAAQNDAHAGRVLMGAWGGPGRSAMAAHVKTALTALGVPSLDAPLDDDTRELGARSTFGDAVLVALTADAHSLRASSLDAARSAARVFGGTGISAYDGPVGDVAKRLATTLPTLGAPAAPPDAPADLFGLARRAALEESVSARRALANAITATATRAALARAATGEYLVVVGRVVDGILISASPTDPRADDPNPKVARMRTIEECAAPLARGGACHVGAVP
jgi:hypothetical protein